MPRGDPSKVNEDVAEALYQEYDPGEHDGAYREYLARMRRAPGRPMICGWLDFTQWWLDRDEKEVAP